jgi:putative heme-binding domain-containing protein
MWPTGAKSIIGHMQHNIRDPNRDHHARTYLPLNRQGSPAAKAGSNRWSAHRSALENLKHPVKGVRHRTRVELSARIRKRLLPPRKNGWQVLIRTMKSKPIICLKLSGCTSSMASAMKRCYNQLLDSIGVPHAVVAAKTVHHFWYNVDLTGSTGFAAPAEPQTVKYDPPKHLSPEDQTVYKLGAEVYQREAHCATCHLSHGKGNANVYPSLVGGPWVLGSEERLIKATLHGLWGKLTVNGITYDPSRGVPPMTAFRTLLKDEELAAVLTFVRNTWGNQAAPVSAASVQRVREQTLDRTTFWIPDELLAEHPIEPELVADASASQVAEFSNVALEQELLATAPAELARIALQEGNALRGKNLFYQSTAACFACHDPPQGAVRLGPDLTKISTARSPQELVESMLQPSKLIDKEFAQVSVLTAGGQIHSGIRISESPQELVLRNLAQPEPIKIPRADIEEVVESKVSLMPENLVRQLKSRKEFGAVAQLVRALDCRSRGCGFEPRRPRLAIR